jgi:hypothetical protein
MMGFVGLGLVPVLAVSGHELIAGIFGTTTIVGLVTVFVSGKKCSKRAFTQTANDTRLTTLNRLYLLTRIRSQEIGSELGLPLLSVSFLH